MCLVAELLSEEELRDQGHLEMALASRRRRREGLPPGPGTQDPGTTRRLTHPVKRLTHVKTLKLIRL